MSRQQRKTGKKRRKTRSIPAHSLEDPKFRQRVHPGKLYKRKNINLADIRKGEYGYDGTDDAV